MWDKFDYLQIGFLHFLQSQQNDALDGMAVAISSLGNYTSYVVGAAAVVWLIGDEGLFLGLLAVSCMVGADAMKGLFGTERPIGMPGVRSLYLESAGGASFPSGHALVAVAFYGQLAVRALRKSPLAAIALAVIPLLIGISRLYLGVHWPIDVVGGWLLGLGLLALTQWRPLPWATGEFWWIMTALVASATIKAPETDIALRFVAAAWIAALMGLRVSPSKGSLRALGRLTIGGGGFAAILLAVRTAPGFAPWAPVVEGVWTVGAGRLFEGLGV